MGMYNQGYVTKPNFYYPPMVAAMTTDIIHANAIQYSTEFA